jgi:hypothetical protein
MSSLLTFMLVFCGAITVLLVVLVIYGNVLDSREDEEIYLNPEQQKMMAGDQPDLIRRMNRLAGVIKTVAIIAGISVVATAGFSAWYELYYRK